MRRPGSVASDFTRPLFKMLPENALTTFLARVAGIPFRLRARRPFMPPQKALILHPCCISQVMLATPLLAALSRAYPQARFDWAISEWARPAISGNPRLAELVPVTATAVSQLGRAEVRHFIEQLKRQQYDTCFIPGRSFLLAYIAWRAGIPQRVGINIQGRGFAHTLPVTPPPGERHAAKVYFSLATAIGAHSGQSGPLPMEFYPSDAARTAVTRRLIDELDWLGDVPLVVFHPGGGAGSDLAAGQKRWPVERFVRLGNHFIRQHQARIVVVGSEQDRALAADIVGMMPVDVADWTGRVRLSDIGALGEVADLYVGNDTGPTHIAAAVGCPTLAIFGPSDPALSAPYGEEGKVETLWHENGARPFSWDDAVTVGEAIKAADRLLKRKN